LQNELDEVTRVLSILEATEFRWTINDVFAQPETWADDIFSMKAAGEKINSSGRRKSRGSK